MTNTQPRPPHRTHRRWTRAELAYLESYKGERTYKEIAHALGRTESAVSTMASVIHNASMPSIEEVPVASPLEVKSVVQTSPVEVDLKTALEIVLMAGREGHRVDFIIAGLQFSILPPVG